MAVREPNHKSIMTRSFFATHTRPAEVTVAALPVDRPLNEFVLKASPETSGFASGVSDKRNGRISMLCLVTSAARSYSNNGHLSRDIVVMLEDGNDLNLNHTHTHTTSRNAQETSALFCTWKAPWRMEAGAC